MIKLCYKEYDYKMDLAAMRRFKEETDKDLWCCLVNAMEAYFLSEGDPIITRLKNVYNQVDFFTASQLFYSVIKSKKDGIPLDEIQDAMFRCGILPSDDDSDKREPWPMVLIQLGVEINKSFEAFAEKKSDISEQSESKS